MAPWFWYAVVAAALYGAHQIFTRMASDHIGDGIGGFVVEATAALSILLYVAFLYFSGRHQKFSSEGFWYSALTGLCVGAGTIAFFLLFSAERTIIFGAGNPCRWRGDHGRGRNILFRRSRLSLTHRRDCTRTDRSLLAPLVTVRIRTMGALAQGSNIVCCRRSS